MSRGSLEDLTPTSFAMLGLLATRPWSTYELAKQMQRSVRWFWPRAERKLYDEPKRLAALGLVSVRSEMTGRRASTIYEITPAGRSALRAWVGDATFAPPQIEMEGLVHLFFAENGSPEEMRATLRLVGDHARESLAALYEMSAVSVDDDNGFPDRHASNSVGMELYVRLHETIRDWADWAETEVAGWPEVRRGRRSVAIGPRARGCEIFAAIARRTGSVGAQRRKGRVMT